MKKPQRVRILGKQWAIIWTTGITDEGAECYGTTDLEEQEIKVDDSILSLEKEQEIVLHEITHALMDALGEDDHDEKFVTMWARHLLAVIKDNPSLLTYLRARKR